MTITRGVGPVSGKSNAGVTSFSVILTGTTIGRSIAICVIWKTTDSSNDPTSVTITNEANATPIGAPARSTAVGVSQQLFYLGEITTAGPKTITANFNGSDKIVIGAVEYISGDTAAFLDVSNTATGNSPDPSLTLTGVTANAAIFAVMGTKKTNPTAGAGYTLIPLPNILWFTEAEDDVDAGAAGNKTVDFSVGSASWLISAASFKPAGGGGAVTGAIGQTLALTAQGAAGGMTIAGTMGQIAAKAAASAAGTQTIAGGVAQGSAKVAQSTIGGVTIAGVGVQAAKATATALAGAMTIAGAAAQRLKAATQSAIGGGAAILGAVAQAITAAGQAASGGMTIGGGVAQAPAKTAQAGAGGMTITGAVAQGLKAVATALAGALTIAGAVAQGLAAALQRALGGGPFVDQPAAQATTSQSAATLATAATTAATATVAAQVPATLVTVTQEPAS